jgi:hypothetical protein
VLKDIKKAPKDEISRNSDQQMDRWTNMVNLTGASLKFSLARIIHTEFI